LQLERHIAENSGQIGAKRLVGKRRQPGAETSSDVGEALLANGGEIRQTQLYFQNRTTRPDICATQDPDVL
jgi:hypothetical protein